MAGFGIRNTTHKEDLENALQAGLQDWQWYADQTAHAVLQWWKAVDEAGKVAAHGPPITVSIHPSEKHPLIFIDVYGNVLEEQ